MNGVAPDGTIVGEVGGADQSAVRLHERGERGCDFAVIEIRDRIVTEASERRGEILFDDRVAGLGRGAVGFQENLAQSGIAFELRGEPCDFARQVRTRGETAVGEFLRGRRDLLKLHAAEAPERGVDARDLTRHANRQDAIARQVLVGLAVAKVHVGTGLKRRGFAIIECVESMCLRDVDQHEAAAADSARGGIGDAHCQRGSYGGIDGVAAVFEYLNAGARGVLAFRHDHSMDADRGGIGSRRRGIGGRRNEHRDRECDKDGRRARAIGPKLNPAWHRHHGFTNSHRRRMKVRSNGIAAVRFHDWEVL